MSKPDSMRLSLRALAHLLHYPDQQLRTHLGELAQALTDEAAVSAARLDELLALIAHLGSADALQAQAEYVEVFDRGRNTALHLFEHVHGDSRDRGPAMIDLLQTYEQAGLYLGSDELPDHLPVVLEFASTQPARQAREFLAETAHIVRAIFSALLQRQSRYASVLAAVLELAGEKAQTVALASEAPLDESWAEPQVFGACTSRAPAAASAAQTIRFVNNPAALGAQP